MRNNGLQIIRNDEFHESKLENGGTIKKNVYLRFLIFVVILLTLFGGIFFIKHKVSNYKNLEENLNFQKQKIMEERIIMEKTLKEEQEKLSSLKLEYENKNAELENTLNSIKSKEEELNSELKKVYELKEILKNQLVEIYGLNIDKMYDSTNENEDLTDNSGKVVDTDDKSENPIHTGIILDEEDKSLDDTKERILGVANADWFIKFDSLGEFHY